MVLTSLLITCDFPVSIFRGYRIQITMGISKSAAVISSMPDHATQEAGLAHRCEPNWKPSRSVRHMKFRRPKCSCSSVVSSFLLRHLAWGTGGGEMPVFYRNEGSFVLAPPELWLCLAQTRLENLPCLPFHSPCLPCQSPTRRRG
jgi:hypothetical protein